MTEIFWTFLITSGVGLVLAIGRVVYKSKCVLVKCCCIEIQRDTAHETEIDELQMARHRMNIARADESKTDESSTDYV